jgi:TldD protein
MRTLLLSLVCIISLSVSAQKNQPDALMSIIEAELNREMAEFKKAPIPPYFIAYRVTDSQTGGVVSSFGSLMHSSTDRSRYLSTEVRVGDYSFDNSHPQEDPYGMDFNSFMGGRSVPLTLEDKPEAIQVSVWEQTQIDYRKALSEYKNVKSKRDSTEKVPISDFSKENVTTYLEPTPATLETIFNEIEWKERIKKISAPFLSNPNIIDGEASMRVEIERKYFISSEGARIAQNRAYAFLYISGSIRAEDGDVIPLHKSYYALTPAALPTDDVLLADVNKMISQLEKLRVAPLAEPYTGPAILYSHAAGVFFHEIFGHRVEGHRFKDQSDGQTFQGKVQEQVLPSTMSITFDPTRSHFKEQALNGYYKFDDEGIEGQKVKVVDKGVLKTFLMSRTPIKGFEKSNGHARTDGGAMPVSRQSNLIIESEKLVDMADLRRMLISECKKQKKKYGYLFMDVMGGFTTTDRFMPNAFNIFPTEVYRVYTDGRPDELVRGVDLIGTPLAMFAEIKAAGDKSEVFTGFCGAESGSIPVTAISPSLFVKRIETQKKPVAQIDKTLLPMPPAHK